MTPDFSVVGHQELYRAANFFAARQVIPSLSSAFRLGIRQKANCLVFSRWVRIASENLANPVGIGTQLVDNISVADALIAQQVDCNSLFVSERASLFSDNVQWYTGNSVAFNWGFDPKQISHVFSFFVAVRTVSGGSGFLPTVLWCRTRHEGAASSAGVAIENRCPSFQNSETTADKLQPLQEKRDTICCVAVEKNINLVMFECCERPQRPLVAIGGHDGGFPKFVGSGASVFSLFRRGPIGPEYIARVVGLLGRFSKLAGGATMSLCLSADRGQARLRVAPNHLPVDLGRAVASLLRAPFLAGMVHA